ncbi:MAG: T9SS type A sorting domain-containing protein, partial [Aliifodinibius sp.]|nr:T9SS type A sorting domain-containing protein [Fodinibius sp.]
DTRVTMKIYDMLGRELVTLIDRNQDAGYHQIIWDSRDRRGVPVSTGVYIVRIIAGEFKAVRKMVLLR